ncbi:toxin [bacterium]|nr:toxin [bacterium]
MKWKFVEVPPFTTNRERCFSSDEDFRRFQLDLMINPLRGNVIPGASPLRKARWGDEGSARGRSGGCRVIYLRVPEAATIFLIHVYPKTRRENITPEDGKILARLARELKAEAIAAFGEPGQEQDE